MAARPKPNNRVKKNSFEDTKSSPKRKKARIKLDSKAKMKPERAITGRFSARGEKMAPWVAPNEMPTWMVELVKEGKMCGAKKRDGSGFCTMKPVPHQEHTGRPLPWHCRYHGGAKPVGRILPAKAIAIKHGIYSEALLPGERGAYKMLLKEKEGFLDHEIAITKLRLRRAIKAEAEQTIALEHGLERDVMQLSEHSNTVETGPEGARHSTVHKRVLIDYSKKIHEIILELCKLYHHKNILEGGEQEIGPDERAQEVRRLMQEGWMSFGLPPKPELEDACADIAAKKGGYSRKK